MRVLRIINYYVILLVAIACYYDNEEQLYEETETCPLVEVRFAESVAPVIERNCIQCHSNAAQQGGIDLEGYEAIKIHADNGNLVGVISHAPGFSAMPQNANQLPDCTIDQITAWVEQEALNN